MFPSIKNAWKTRDIRKKILYTIFFILVYRFGNFIPVPLVDVGVLKSFLNLEESNTIFGLMDMFSGGAFSNATLFAMGISPHINASIILQLLIVAFPFLEKIQSEGEEGRKKVNRLQKYLTIFIAIVQGIGLYYLLRSFGIILNVSKISFYLIVLSLTAGTAFLVWISELIDEFGIGNGVSLLIFSGIISKLPKNIKQIISYLKTSKNVFNAFVLVILGLVLFICITMLVVSMNNAERRINVQYTKRIVGKKMYESQNTHIPIKVSSAGVTPIIFAMSVVMFPATIVQLFGFNIKPESIWNKVLKVFSPNFWLYGFVYFFLIVFFTYFYTSIQLNPVEISNNMKKSGGFILGIRPGKPTSEYLSKVISKITLVGAIFLGFIAVLPIVLNNVLKVKTLNIGGTSLLIIVGVALDAVRQIESQLFIKNYKGFLV